MSVNKYDASQDLLLQIAGSGSEGSFHRTQAVQALAGATSVTITDSRIHATSLVTPFADNGTNEPIAWKTMTLSEGSCVITFDALEADTDFELVVLADSLSEDAYITDLKDVNISSVSNGQVLAYNGTTGKWVNIDLPNSGIFPHLVINTDTNLTVTVTKGTTVITATETSSGVYECDVDEFGTYTLSDTQYTENVVIDAVKIYEIFMMPDGETVLPTSDVSTWLKCAGIKDKSYTTLQQVLSDSITFNALLGDSNANKYMARSTTWASTLCADQYAMTMIGQYDVCCDELLGNSTWASAIGSSTYSDYVLQGLIPTMTGASTPSGTASASSNTSDAYKAMDNNSSTYWQNTPATSEYVQYEFASAVVCKRCYVEEITGYVTAPSKIKASNDGSTWQEIATPTGGGPTWTIEFYENTTAYKYWRVEYDNPNRYTTRLTKLQFYGHADTGDQIHGANEEVAYYLDGSTQVPISNPSTLDAGTYTFGSTIAKNPDSLSSDYTKQIRITPNTVEVVLRPDKSLYWYGWKIGTTENYSLYASYTNLGAGAVFNINNVTIMNSTISSNQRFYSDVFTTPIDFTGKTSLKFICNSLLQSQSISETGDMYVFLEGYKNASGTKGSAIGYMAPLQNNPSKMVEVQVTNGATDTPCYAIWVE